MARDNWKNRANREKGMLDKLYDDDVLHRGIHGGLDFSITARGTPAPKAKLVEQIEQEMFADILRNVK